MDVMKQHDLTNSVDGVDAREGIHRHKTKVSEESYKCIEIFCI